jgi:hypothetical protein
MRLETVPELFRPSHAKLEPCERACTRVAGGEVAERTF